MNEDQVFGRIMDIAWRKRITATELCEKLGLKKSAFSEWKAGRSRAYLKRLPEIAEILGTTPAYLLQGDEWSRPVASNVVELPYTKRVPLVGEIACGEPILAVENVVDFVNVPLNVNADMALVCKGDSMINARIFDGDVVFIKQQPEVESGEIAAVLIGDEATLKRVFIKEGHVILSPCNPVYDPLVFVGKEIEQVQIIGKAVAFTSFVR